MHYHIYFTFADGKINLRGTQGNMLAEWEIKPEEMTWNKKAHIGL